MRSATVDRRSEHALSPAKAGTFRENQRVRAALGPWLKQRLTRGIIVARRSVHQKKMTVREIAFQRLAEKAMAGDLKALDFLLGLEDAQQSAEGDATQKSAERSLKIIQQFFERQRKDKKE